MTQDILDNNNITITTAEITSFFTIEDLNILNDIDETDVPKNNQSFQNDIESMFSFDAEDLAEWINEDDDLSEKSASSSDDFLGRFFQEDNLDDDSHYSFDAEDLAEWIEEGNDEKHISTSSSSPSTCDLQIPTAENDNEIDHASVLNMINLDKSMCTNLVKSEMNSHNTFGLFHSLNSAKLRTNISRQKVLQHKVTATNLSTNGNERCRSFDMDSLKKRRFLFDLRQSQQRLKKFSSQTSNVVQKASLLGKRINSESTAYGRQKRLRQSRNETPIKNHFAVAA